MDQLVVTESRLYAPIRLGDAAGYAILDTGAGRSSVLRSKAGGFTRVGKRESTGGRRGVAPTQACIDEITFLGETHTAISADVISDTGLNLASAPGEVLLVAGADLLWTKPLHLDFVRRQIGHVALPHDARWRRVPGSFHHPLPVFDLSLGLCRVQAAFDTGASLSVLDQTLLALVLGHLVQDEPVEAEDVSGNALILPTFICRGISVDGLLLPPTRALGIDMATLVRAADLNVRFVLGLNAMAGHEWVLDAGGGAIYIAEALDLGVEAPVAAAAGPA